MDIAKRDGNTTQRESCDEPTQPHASNARWYTYRYKDSIVVQSLEDAQQSWIISLEQYKQNVRLLELSSVNLSHLALASSDRVWLYDLAERQWTHALLAVRSTITSIAWSSYDPSLVAVGCLDGYVRLWNPEATDRQARYATAQVVGPVEHIAWSAASDDVLALATPQQLCIWHIDSSPQLVSSFERHPDTLTYLRWHPRHTRTLLTASAGGQITVWDFTQTTRKLPKLSPGVFAQNLGVLPEHKPVQSLSLNSDRRTFVGIRDIRWISAQTALVLYSGGTQLGRFDVRNQRFGTIDWTADLENAATALVITSVAEQQSCLLAVSPQSVNIIDLAVELPEQHPTVNAEAEDQHAKSQLLSPGVGIDDEKRAMDCQQITRKKTGTPSLKRLAGQLRNKPNAAQAEHRKVLQHLDQPGDYILTPVANITSPSSFLDLPFSGQDHVESPMPFLSPSIPAKAIDREVDGLLSIADIMLPAAHATSYFVPMSSVTTGQDSDSDDDDYGAQLLGNGAMLSHRAKSMPPARFAGASFASDGSLLMFHPTREKPKLAKPGSLLESLADQPDNARTTSTHFPRFGNLLGEINSSPLAPNHAVQRDEAVTYDNVSELVVQALGLDAASFDSSQSWKPRSFQGDKLERPALGRTATTVSVKTFNISALSSSCKPEYETSITPNTNGAELCNHNAGMAIEHGKQDDALLWAILARILTLPLPENEVVHESKVLSHIGSKHWANHPFGSTWLVKRLFQQAEAAGNLRMLAYLSMTLITPSLSQHDPHLSSLTKSRRGMSDRTARKPSNIDSIGTMLRLDRVDSQVLEDSPTKAYIESMLSSRQASQPTTPKLDSSSSTPPWSFSGFPTKHQKPSQMSGSASPEHTRSSFSAAVKSYAQSVSDKFAVYSTSPPVRRGIPSPNNELSSSLPGAGGSWSKTVSFASTAKSSGLGRQPTDQDLDYDSDRTVEDNPPLRPRTQHKVGLKFDWKNEQDSDEEFAAKNTFPLIPPELHEMSKIWCSTYASRLRSIKQDTLAVQFENVAAAISAVYDRSANIDVSENQMMVELLQPVACSICSCVIAQLAQACLLCHHAMHVSCLADLSITIDEFVCPAGCGCDCLSSITALRT